MAERPEDLNLPSTVVSRIIKESLPDGVTISKEARIAISKAASVFILYASSTANSYATEAKRKTLTANDVLCAIEEMSFDMFLDPLKISLEAFRAKKNSKKHSNTNIQENTSNIIKDLNDNNDNAPSTSDIMK